MDSFNKASRDKDNILDQIHIKERVNIFFSQAYDFPISSRSPSSKIITDITNYHKTALTAHIAISKGLNAEEVLAAAIAEIRARYSKEVNEDMCAYPNKTKHKCKI